ncbi:MAG: tripartite tricarboxylate transporter permease, partial [Eubacteriales bacterium]|nr:tripartite tricarboxylate transporter permease [Eubacteriales bacterium]
MTGLESLLVELGNLMDVRVLAILFISTILGIMIGALPGLSATMGIALLTGLTYKFPVVYTFAILMGVYVGAIYGGSISAILLNIPGTASAAATALEGHPLALQGKAESAIKVTRAASIIGTFIGVLALTLITPPLTKVALMFTSAEYCMLALFGVLICGSIVSSDLPIKGWIGGLIGLLVAMIGMDKLQGASRFDFGNTSLMSGVSLVPAMIGFYAIPEVIKAFAKSDGDIVVGKAEDKVKEKVRVWPLLVKNIRVIIQSALIGIGVGSLPGVGEDVAAWVAYDTAKKTSKHPEKFGTGCYEGAIAPEVGNNAAIGGALIPMLTLAVPGSPPAAVLLGALMIHNIRPGPMLMRDNPTF